MNKHSEHDDWLRDQKWRKKETKKKMKPADQGRPGRKNSERDDDSSIINQSSSHPY